MKLRDAILPLLFALLAVPAQACTKKVRWSDDGLYFFKQADGTVSGFSAELTRELLHRVGCEAEFIEMPWARALAELESGRLDILTGTIITPERQRYAYFSRFKSHTRNALFMPVAAMGKYPAQRLEDLIGSDFRLGVQIGVTYGTEFDALAARAEFRKLFKPVSARRNAWRMMEVGRLEGMIADISTGQQELKQLGLSKTIQPTAITMTTAPATYAFSKRTTTPAFVEQFDQAYAAALADRSHQKLVDKFLPGAQLTTQ